MRTQDLITALTVDTIADRGVGWRRLARAAPLALLAAGGGFLAIEGVRAGLATPDIWPIVARKLLVTVSLTAAAGALAVRATRPDPLSARALVVLAAPLLALAFLVWRETAELGLVAWRARLLGEFSWKCSAIILAIAAPLTAAILWAQANGAARSPAAAGAAAGLAATGAAASVYALHCTDDSALFVACWYGLAALIAAWGGAAAGRRALAW